MTPIYKIFTVILAMISFFAFIISNEKVTPAAEAASPVIAADRASAAALTLVKKQLPKTQIQSINCNQPIALCEIRAGQNIYYTDKAGKFLVIGHLYDLDRKVNLTEASMRNELPSLESSDGVAVERIAGRVGFGAAKAMPASYNDLQTKQRLDMAKLPYSGAIIWGKPTGVPVYIFTDFRCGYCRALSQELKKMNVKVYEFPISILGSRDLSEAVFCAKNKVAALEDAYAGVSVVSPKCNTKGLDLNEQFARQNDLAETPIIVRPDGEVIRGMKPRKELIDWLNGGKS
jgi:thiol:disulfide interchange protein DsbC